MMYTIEECKAKLIPLRLRFLSLKSNQNLHTYLQLLCVVLVTVKSKNMKDSVA